MIKFVTTTMRLIDGLADEFEPGPGVVGEEGVGLGLKLSLPGLFADACGLDGLEGERIGRPFVFALFNSSSLDHTRYEERKQKRVLSRDREEAEGHIDCKRVDLSLITSKEELIVIMLVLILSLGCLYPICLKKESRALSRVSEEESGREIIFLSLK